MLQNNDTTVNVIDPQTGVSITTAPAKYIETTYLDASSTPNEGDIDLLVLANDRNTGYALFPVASLLAAGQLPPEHQRVFDSFESIAANSTNTAIATTARAPLSPFQQQLQQLQQP